MTREEILETIGRMIWDGTDTSERRAASLADGILDWLDEIGYYNMHFYGVASKDITIPKEERKE